MAKGKEKKVAITKDNDHVESGILCEIYPIEQKSEKFTTRKFVVDTSYTYQGNDYTQFAVFQLVNAQCDLIDSHKIGDLVKVHFNIRGSGGRDKKNNPVVFTNLGAYRIGADNIMENNIDNESQTIIGKGYEAVDDLPF